MSKWLKHCEAFTAVRTLIDEEIETPRQCMRILYALEACCDELTPNDAKDWEFYEEFREMKSEIHDVLEDYEHYRDDVVAVVINSLLSEFYDLCDSARVWLVI